MRYGKTLAIAGLYSNLFFLFIFTLMHFIRPDKSIAGSFVSEYAVGNYGWLMTLGFFCLATGSLCLLIGLLNSIKASKTAIVTLCIWCTGAFLFSIFTTDLPGTPPTPQGLIHGFSALIALVNLGISMLAWGFTFTRNDNWLTVAKTSWVFGGLGIAMFIVFLFSPPSLRGLTERILIVWDVSWLVLVSRQLYINSI
ncbi:DUF998 domain-containing protein [Mucilaginibacter sp.]|uniref:DUF998 domain-containing protein n=1 Tax=Mucilaginibacter sp. TaxID=1882438 RepID=UPI0025E9B07A|nr:DUF998 domain-containing protein [Mucilaginibacter sp.]